MTTEKLPAVRAVASAGRVHFGFKTADWGKLEDTGLHYEATPDRLREIARELVTAADHAEDMARAFPRLVPLDDTKAITAGSVHGTEDAETGDDGGIAEPADL